MLLSIVIPAWNEEKRLLPVLRVIRSYGDSMLRDHGYEVIVVDDGSGDSTAALVAENAEEWPELRLIILPENCGKGAAVRTGCVNAHGRFILLYDADGATPIEQEALLRAELTDRPDLHLAMGVRYSGGCGVTMGIVRRSLGWLFTCCASRVVGRPCLDTQCGFKMFRGRTVLPIVRRCRENGYTFDVELLTAIHRQGLAISESSIPWTAIPGSKVSIVRDGSAMLWRLAAIRLRHMSGVFSHVGIVPEPTQSATTANSGSTCSSFTVERAANE